jgi:DUF3043 family protein
VALLFRRKSEADELVEEPDAVPEVVVESTHAKGHTPSKKERGLTTPKRPNAHVRRPGATDTRRPRGQLTKEERKEVREERRARRREITEGMRRGDERYLSARDKGPERALARDVVDSRRNAGTWFFAGALIVLFGSSATMPQAVRLAANLLWGLVALAVVVDGVLLCRKLKRLLRERYPDSTERRGSLYMYVVMRSITFRRMRIPKPRVGYGDKI